MDNTLLRKDSPFSRFSKWVSRRAGHAASFALAILAIAVWAVTGPLFGFSDTWQLVINTGTTIVTFLMVFLIQNTQNRDSMALHLKMDEIIRAIDAADDELIRAEDESEEELGQLKERYRDIMLAQRKLLKSAMSEHVEGLRTGPEEAPASQEASTSG
jgi:low affinity Fe/Cu permease